MRRLLKLKSRPDAVFCYNDPTAWGVMLALFEAGLKVPEDIAVVGCGSVLYSELMRVPLTSVDQHARLMGREAANLAQRAIRKRLSGSRGKSVTVLLNPALVVRDSTTAKTRLKPPPRASDLGSQRSVCDPHVEVKSDRDIGGTA